MLKVNRYTEKTVELFNSNQESLGQVNKLEFMDFICQIIKSQTPASFQELSENSGYYFKWNGKRYDISKYGEHDWTDLWMEEEDLYLTKLSYQKSVLIKS